MSWAVNASNCLANVHGFSPYQIVYDRDPNLPSNSINKPSALENKMISKGMQRHLISLQEAQKAYLVSESSERSQRALRKQIKPKAKWHFFLSNRDSSNRENVNVAGSDTKNNDFLDMQIKVIEDENLGAITNIEKDKSVSARQVNPNVIKIQKNQVIKFQPQENGVRREAKILEQARKASTKTKKKK